MRYGPFENVRFIASTTCANRARMIEGIVENYPELGNSFHTVIADDVKIVFTVDLTEEQKTFIKLLG